MATDTPNTDASSETPDTPVSKTETVNTPPSTDVTSGDTTATAPSADDLQAQIKRMEDALKKANNEAKENRLAAAELKKMRDDAEAAKLSETERLQKQLAQLQKERDDSVRQSQEQKISAEIRIRALAAGVKEERLGMVSRLIDTKDIEIVDGEPTNIKELMSALLKDMPELAPKGAQVPTSGGATNPSRTQSSTPPEISWDIIGRLQPGENGMYKDAQTGAQYNPAEISRWQLSNPQRYGTARSHTR